MRIVADAASAYAQAGYYTVIDGIFIPGWFFEPLRDALVARGNRVAYAVLRAPLAGCLARSEGRDREPLTDKGAVEQLWNAFSELGDLERHVVSTENADPSAVVDVIIRSLDDLLTSPG